MLVSQGSCWVSKLTICWNDSISAHLVLTKSVLEAKSTLISRISSKWNQQGTYVDRQEECVENFNKIENGILYILMNSYIFVAGLYPIFDVRRLKMV